MNTSDENYKTVMFLNIEEYQDKDIVHFYHEETHQWAFVRNREILCGRLIQGAMIKIMLYPLIWNDVQVLEASLIINEDEMLPVDLIPLLVKNMPAQRTGFGFISEPSEDKGRYYAIFKHRKTGLLLCTGGYTIENNQGNCLGFDNQWIIRDGLIENYFFNQHWPESSIIQWRHDNFSISEILDNLSIEDLNLEFRNNIAGNNLLEFFYSDDWSPDFYRAQAKLGFIAITHTRNGELQLLPQLQSAYALLDWEKLTIDKKVRKIMNSSRILDENISLCIDSDPSIVLKNLQSAWGETSWLKPPYEKLITKLASGKEQHRDKSLRIWGVTLTAGKEKIPIAGELGYTIGKTYTSLTGFFKREKKEFNNFGKLQLVMLAEILEKSGILFWNLGHPYMKYKTDLGAEIVPRELFLERWDKAVRGDSADLTLD